MTAEDEEAVALEMEQLEREAQGTLNGTAPIVGIQVSHDNAIVALLNADLVPNPPNSLHPKWICLLLPLLSQWASLHPK
jgi:hypothetical protein